MSCERRCKRRRRGARARRPRVRGSCSSAPCNGSAIRSAACSYARRVRRVLNTAPCSSAQSKHRRGSRRASPRAARGPVRRSRAVRAVLGMAAAVAAARVLGASAVLGTPHRRRPMSASVHSHLNASKRTLAVEEPPLSSTSGARARAATRDDLAVFSATGCSATPPCRRRPSSAASAHHSAPPGRSALGRAAVARGSPSRSRTRSRSLAPLSSRASRAASKTAPSTSPPPPGSMLRHLDLDLDLDLDAHLPPGSMLRHAPLALPPKLRP